MAQASIKNAIFLKVLLDVYCHYYGEAINIDKSYMIFSPSISTDIKSQIRCIIPMWVMHSILRYLGVPLFGVKLKAIDFNYLLDKVATKLDNWKYWIFSYVGIEPF